MGITNDIAQRTDTHARVGGWQIVDAVGPMNGETALDIETEIKRWLKVHVGTLPRKTENWSTANLEVHSLNELIALAKKTRVD